MAHGVIYGQDGVVRVPLARTRLPVNGIVAGSGIVAGATPNTFVVQELGYHQIDFDFNVNSPTNDTPFTLQLWNETAGMLVQSRNAVSPQQAHASDMYFGFEWNNASLTDEYAFYVVPNIGTAPSGFALLLQEINFRAVVQEFAGASGTVGPGTVNRIAKFIGVNTVGDSIMAEAGTVISVAGSVNLAGVNTDTFLSFTDGQNVPVSAASTGRIRYNALTQTFQFSENGGAWADLSGIGPGTINRIAKFTAADAVGDSTITDDGTTVTVNTSMSVTATQTRLGVASTLTGSLIYANATNANTVTLQSGVTTASYTLTLPLAQSGAGQVLSNDGAGVLSWATPVLGSGSANALAKFTAATTIGDSTITDDGTTVAINTSLSVTATQTRLGVASTLTGSLVYANATNVNTVTLQSGVTAASYTLTLPLAQSGAGQVLSNDGAGVLSWATPVLGSGSANALAKFTAATTIGDSTITDDGTTVAINTSLSVTATQTRLGVASTLTGSLVYANATNVNTVTLQSGVTAASYTLTLPLAQSGAGQVLSNDGAGVLSWATPVLGSGSANALAKFTAATTIGDSTITDDGTTVAINTSLSVTATQTRLGVASTLTGSLVYANATNVNTVTLQSGVTAASYTLTLPLAQSGAGQVLSNDGAGVLSWATPVLGSGSANALAKFTAATTIGDSTITDDGTTVAINTSMSVTATQTRLGVASTLTGSLVYANATNVNTVTLQSGVTAASYTLTLPLAQSGAGQVLSNDGAGVLSWATPVLGSGSANALAKFTAATTIGDSTITDDGTTVAINTSLSVTATQTRLGVASSLTGSLVYANATNANTVTIQSGVTAASYTLTLPLAQSGAGQVLSNDGAGVLSWATPSAHDQNASTIIIPNGIGTPARDDVQDFLNICQSEGRLTGGAITAHAGPNGTADIAEMEGLIKAGSSIDSPLVYFKKAATASISLTDLSVNYIIVTYSAPGGVPTLTYSSTVTRPAANTYGVFVVGRCWRSGNTVEALTTGQNVYDMYGRTQDRMFTKYGAMDRASGGVVSAHATPLRLSASAGVWFFGNTRIDTDAADTFEVWYRTGGGAWTSSSSLTLFSDVFDGGTSKVYETYQNGTSLAALGVSKYGVYWVYVCPEGEIYVVLGTASYSTIGAAQAATVPASLPPYCVDWSRLVGRVIIQKTAAAFYSVESAFSTSFALSSAVDHMSLSNLTTAGAHPATSISNTAAGDIVATTVQAAIDELDTKKISTYLPFVAVDGTLATGANADVVASKLVYNKTCSDSDGNDVIDLHDGTVIGQIVTIYLGTKSGSDNAVITPVTKLGYSTITLDTVAKLATLQWQGAVVGWAILYTSGTVA